MIQNKHGRETKKEAGKKVMEKLYGIIFLPIIMITRGDFPLITAKFSPIIDRDR